MALGKTVGEIPHHFSICTFSDSNNELLHSSLPHIKIKHTDCSNCSGQPHHCTLLSLSKCMVNPTTARYSISASASESFQCHTSSTQKSRVKYLLLHSQVQRTLTITHIQLVSLNKSCLQYIDTYIHIYIYIKCTKLTTVFSVAQRRNDLTSRQLEGTLQRLEFY